MIAGFDAPLPPRRTGVADYAASLLAAMRAHGEVRTGGPADIVLYHLGNNALHRDIYRRALARPGVVLLHDAVLHHLFLGSMSQSEYVAEFTYNYGKWMEDLARELWRSRSRSAADARYFEFPMLRRIAESSLGVVVHNSGAASIVRRHAPGARIAGIPHLCPGSAAAPGWQVQRTRQALGLDPRAFLFAVFGYLRESKRLPGVLRAFGRARAAMPNVRLLVAGDFVSTDLERSMAGPLSAPGVLRRPWLPRMDFHRLASACDACINLRYPAAGETSGIAVRLMALGKPVILTDGAENADLPEDVCVHIDAGVAEEEMLSSVMVWLASTPGAAAAIGRRAAEHVARFHSPDRAARLYWDFLDACRG